MVRLAGIEPATSGSTIRRSNQLSYNRTRCLRSAKRPYGQMKHNTSPMTTLSVGDTKKERPERMSGLSRPLRKAGDPLEIGLLTLP